MPKRLEYNDKNKYKNIQKKNTFQETMQRKILYKR